MKEETGISVAAIQKLLGQLILLQRQSNRILEIAGAERWSQTGALSIGVNAVSLLRGDI